MTRDDLARFRGLDIDFGSIGLEWSGNDVFYFCTPTDAEFVGWTGSDGVHFILLPGDERVFCVDPSMGEPGTHVLPVAEDFLQFLSFILYCRDACPLAELRWLEENRFRQALREDAEARWPGCESLFEKRTAALAAIAAAFPVAPADPYAKVKALQAGFDPSTLNFSDEYYDVLSIERESKRR